MILVKRLIEALKKGMPALLKGAKALKAGIGKSLKLIVKPFKSIGRLIGNIFDGTTSFTPTSTSNKIEVQFPSLE